MSQRPSLQRLDQLLQHGEGEHLEFKSRFTSDADIARSLVAFANADGGILLIGVDQTPSGVEVLGLTEPEEAKTRERLRHLARSLLPTPIPVDSVELEGKPVVYASVNPLPPHLKPATTATGEAYERQQASDVRVERAESVPPPMRDEPLRVFVAMSFREEEEPALVDYYRAIERAAERVGSNRFELIRIDRVEGDYEIPARIIDEITACDALLADFTLSPRNVYFELGVARGQRKPVIQTARRDTTLEFDIRNWRTIFYRNATELEEHLIPAFTELVRRLASGPQQPQ